MSTSKKPKLVQLKVTIPKALDRAIEIHVATVGITKRQFVEAAIRMALPKMVAA
jgi:hypothetical protein